MKKTVLAFIIMAVTTLSIPALAEEIRQLDWKDLIPKHLNSQDPLAGLPQGQKDLAIWAINMLESLPERIPETEEFYKEIDKAMPALTKAGIDIEKVMKKRKELQTAIVDDLHGRLVRMPGYLLPLEVVGAKVTEFLLVPYIGACIHVPPPPPNQIVYVKVIKKAYLHKGLYDPVWVTGKMSVKSMSRDLYLVDGSADVSIGYALEAKQVEPYE
ncbi:MAG: DUF3299 domain-containing protein [Desulfobacteraceae bacterium]|jgi:hypothetical protein